MLLYVGKGHIVGVPARNLTDEEVEKYGKSRLLRTGLYREQAKPAPSANKASKGPAETKDKDGA